MRAFISFCSILLLFVSCQAFIEDPTLKDEKQVEEGPARSIFHKFVAFHEREYAGNDEEWEKRFNIFHNNMKIVSQHNQKELPYKLALNELADSSHEEVLQRKMGMAPAPKVAPNDDLPPVPDHDIPEIYNPFPRGVPSHSDCSYKLADVKYPGQIDWRELGVVAPIRNQGHCGAGWAFATTTVVESMNAILLGEFVELSDQVQIDCNWRGGGCDGGATVEEGYKWALANGLPRFETYPRAYKSKQGTCNMSRSYPVETKAAIFDTYELIPAGEDNLKKALAIGPAAVQIDATCEDFKFYHSGVYTTSDGCDSAGAVGSLTHAMVVVGFNADGDANGVPYWIVRNSWGEEWGEGGYMKMAMFQGDAGLYGLARSASRPVKDGSTAFHLWSRLPEWAVQARHQLQLNMVKIPDRINAIKEAEKEKAKDAEKHEGDVEAAIKVGMQGFGYRKALMW